LRATRPDLSQPLKAGAREGTFQRSMLRSTLVVAQATLSVVLIVGAGLFIRSLLKVHAIDLGYELDHLVTASVSASDPEDTSAAVAVHAAVPGVVNRLASLPGAEAVATSMMPVMQGVAGGWAFLPNGDTVVFAKHT